MDVLREYIAEMPERTAEKGGRVYFLCTWLSPRVIDRLVRESTIKREGPKRALTDRGIGLYFGYPHSVVYSVDSELMRK